MAYTQLELRVGETMCVKCVEDDGSFLGSCSKCCLSLFDCRLMDCSPYSRRGGKSVHFEEIKVEDKNS